MVGQPENSDERISEDQVPEAYRFPAMFRGEGVRGHRYHVFDEPRYVGRASSSNSCRDAFADRVQVLPMTEASVAGGAQRQTVAVWAWGSAWSTTYIACRHAHYSLIRGCVVLVCWGEG